MAIISSDISAPSIAPPSASQTADAGLRAYRARRDRRPRSGGELVAVRSRQRPSACARSQDGVAAGAAAHGRSPVEAGRVPQSVPMLIAANATKGTLGQCTSTTRWVAIASEPIATLAFARCRSTWGGRAPSAVAAGSTASATSSVVADEPRTGRGSRAVAKLTCIFLRVRAKRRL